MGVPVVVTDLNATAASNSPQGGDSIGTSLDDYLRALSAFIRQLFDTDIIWGGTASGTNTITFTASPAPTAYKTGQGFAWISAGANTGAVTANANSLGAKAVQYNGAALSGSELPPAGGIAVAIYDGTQLQLVNTTKPTISNNFITNAMLAQAATLTIKSNITGGTANESDNTLTAIIDACIGSTQGQILYRGASAWAVLAPGSSGNLLQSGGAGANPSWVSAPVSGIFTKSYSSGYSAYTTSAQNILAHGLGTRPALIVITFKCTTGENGYSVNDIVSMLPGLNDNNASGAGWGVVMDSTNLTVRTGASGPEMLAKNSGANVRATPANWSWQISAYA